MADAYPLLRSLLFTLDPESAHELTLRALEFGIRVPVAMPSDPVLGVDLFGRRLVHPLGLAAGFDKNARVIAPMFALGFTHVEIGGITPLPQAGNPRPRVFRLPQHAAVINRMGFPNDGAYAIESRLRETVHGGMLGINLAANADAADPVADFTSLVARFAPYADYLTLDISCPNTANGQLFLDPGRLRELLAAVAGVPLSSPRPAVVAKLSPDIARPDLATIVDVLARAKIDAIIVSNTTAARPPDLDDPRASERGGLSGAPLFAASTALLAEVAALSGRTIPLIGVGGIAGGAEAYAKIRAGATALQLYTALVYHGPGVVARIARELAALLRRDGFASIAEAAA